MHESKGREDNQFSTSGSDWNSPKKNRFYTLQASGEQEYPPNVYIGMFLMFYYIVVFFDHV